MASKGAARSKPRFTHLQGQYLAFIETYTTLYGVAPAEADMQRFFRVTPPAVHRMVLALEERGLLRRVPGESRSIRLLLSWDEIPKLERRGRDGAFSNPALQRTGCSRCSHLGR
ncbi:MAG: LexA family protein [bacterium]